MQSRKMEELDHLPLPSCHIHRLYKVDYKVIQFPLSFIRQHHSIIEHDVRLKVIIVGVCFTISKLRQNLIRVSFRSLIFIQSK